MPPVDELDSSTPIVVPLLLLLLLLLLELDSVSPVVVVIGMPVVDGSVVELPEVISEVPSVVVELLVEGEPLIVLLVPVPSVSPVVALVPSSPQANAAQTKVK